MGVSNWAKSVLSDGYRIQFTSPPQPWRPPKVTNSTERDAAVRKLLTSGVIEQAPDQQDRRFLSNLFVVQEKTKNRPILDCSLLNRWVQCNHFKMEGVSALRELLEPGDFMLKLDIRDAFTLIPIHEASRKYLCFDFHGTIMRYTSLAFGLSVSPLVYHKIQRFPAELLRKQGIKCVYYLDDWCLIGPSRPVLQAQAAKVIQLLTKLGYIINWRKSVLTPSRTQEFLGFTFQTDTMEIKVPRDKLAKLQTRIRQAQQSVHSCRWIASLIGKMTAVIPAVGEALLHVRFLQRDLAKGLQGKQSRWDSDCPLSQNAREELKWWQADPIVSKGLPIRYMKASTSDIDVYVDASDEGYGISSPLYETNGFWSEEEKETSINARELKTIMFALKIHAKSLQGKTLTIYSDSRTAIKYAKNAGGTASAYLQTLALLIQDIVRTHDLTVLYRHVAGIRNVIADKLSRQARPEYEKHLPWKWFHRIQQKWPTTSLVIDAFAGHHNRRLERYWSERTDPFAEAVDAFRQRWPPTGLYIYPPWRLIPKVIQKLQQDRVKTAILVTPTWPAQYWWPLVLHHSQDRPFHMKVSQSRRLTAWRLCSTGKSKKGFRWWNRNI